MGGEGDGLAVEGNLVVPPHVLAHHRLGPVIDDGGGHASEVIERPAMAVPERHQVLAGDEAAEGVAAVRQRHVEAPDVHGAVGAVEEALVAPVHLGLGSGEDLEAAVQLGGLGPEPLPGLGHIELHPLVGAAEAVFVAQALVDRRGLKAALLGQHMASITGAEGSMIFGLLDGQAVAVGGRSGASGDRYFFTVRQSWPVSRAISAQVAPASRRAR